jgi:hypothetical protein
MKIKRVNEMFNEIKLITPDNIEKMENEMGEWIVDIVDASMYFNKPDVKERYFKYFEEKYPELMKLVKEYESEEKSKGYTRNLDISEVIHDIVDDKISKEDYYKYCAEIYNLDKKVNEFFWEMWEEYEIE